MAKQGVNKKYSVSASGVLSIENGILTISVEDIGDFRLDALLRDFDGCPIKFTAVYDEEQESPEVVNVETGEIVE